jgi:hypothetical protein
MHSQTYNHNNNNNNTISQNHSFVLLEITEIELTTVVHNFKNKKSKWLDDTSPYSSKKHVPYTLQPLLELVNASITEGTFPFTLKTSS